VYRSGKPARTSIPISSTSSATGGFCQTQREIAAAACIPWHDRRRSALACARKSWRRRSTLESETFSRDRTRSADRSGHRDSFRTEGIPQIRRLSVFLLSSTIGIRHQYQAREVTLEQIRRLRCWSMRSGMEVRAGFPEGNQIPCSFCNRRDTKGERIRDPPHSSRLSSSSGYRDDTQGLTD